VRGRNSCNLQVAKKLEEFYLRLQRGLRKKEGENEEGPSSKGIQGRGVWQQDLSVILRSISIFQRRMVGQGVEGNEGMRNQCILE